MNLPHLTQQAPPKKDTQFSYLHKQCYDELKQRVDEIGSCGVLKCLAAADYAWWTGDKYPSLRRLFWLNTKLAEFSARALQYERFTNAKPASVDDDIAFMYLTEMKSIATELANYEAM
jgi:hypothetical protein